MNLIIDGSNLIHRSHWINKSRGEDSISQDIYVFLNALKFYCKNFNTNNVYICWDKKYFYPERNFRQSEENVEYKENRNKEKAKEVYRCEEMLTNITMTLGCKNFYPGVLEADDVISWLCDNIEGPKIIVTNDHDLLQLIRKDICVYLPNKKKIIDYKNFKAMFEVARPEFLPIYKSILGDKSDNIEGLPGYGKKKSLILTEEYLNNKNNIDKDKLEIIERNIKLIDLKQGYNIEGSRELNYYKEQLFVLKDVKPDLSSFKEYCNHLKFNSYLKNFSVWEEIFNKKPSVVDILNGATFI